MNHIFYLHSNTCVISSFDVIGELLSRNENVIIITERNTKFPFFEGRVKLYDMQKIIDAYRKKTNNLVKLVINYRVTLHPQCKRFAEEIINNEDFIFYTPSYNMYTVKPFLQNKYIRGYYFIEEGFMSYLSEKTLWTHFRNKQIKKGRALMKIVGAGESYDYKVTTLFKGCYGLSKYSFPWCDEQNKFLSQFDGYFSSIPYERVNSDYLITTDFLKADINIIKSAFRNVIEEINVHGKDVTIAIKFHPQALVYEKNKTEEVIRFLRKEYSKINFVILPAHFSVEAMMFYGKINLYCVFGLSSLQLYGLMLNANVYMVNKESEIICIRSIPEFLELSTKDWNS